jgi:inorganic pyrophosphatase
MENSFWTRLDELIESSEIVIDRPKGSRHPRYNDIIFPLDYGYLSGTTTIDGNGIDVWIGTTEHRRLTAIACTVDIMKRDAEIKLIIGCTDEEIGIIEKFHNGPYQSAIIIRREADQPS